MKKLFLMCIFLIACGVNGSPGEGEKIGTIVRLNKTGILCKTWQAELIRGGMSGGNGAFGVQPFDFTVSDEQAPTVQAAMEKQTEVKIKYIAEGVWSNCRSASTDGHFLTSITSMKDSILPEK